MQSKSGRLLVTGATGYIGGRLVTRLLNEGYSVRLLVRDAARLRGRVWSERVEIVQGDVFDSASLALAMAGVDVAYYLVHSMAGNDNFQGRDIVAAQNFGKASREANVQRIIYLGGLGDPEADLSQHLRSRQQTGAALAQAGVRVTEFRAAVVVGSGSISFEMIRYLTERVPLMVCPRWVFNRIQPIAIRNVLDYLVAALETPDSSGRVIEIGGADVQTYATMMLIYAQERGLKRWLIPVPVLTPRLSSYWVHLVTPISARMARPLIEGLRNEVVVRDDSARQLFPHIHPVDYRTAVQMALSNLETGQVETSWSDALVTSQGDQSVKVLSIHEGMISERRVQIIQGPPSAAFRVFTGLGGSRGWLYFNWAWELRGLMDRLIGGVGLRRGRRDPSELRVGDAVDFWRVEAVEENRLLRLRAEMKVPGTAWLQFEAHELPDQRTRLVQTAFFAPKGVAGLAYWYALYPMHALIFSGMSRAIGNKATVASR
jgi:uncharacterized protein YbjT (DUF2867 family)